MSNQSTATYTARYRNTFFKGANRTEYGPEFFETGVRPVEYRGFQIYHRQDNCWDIVSDGACIGQYAGPNGARRRIDVLCSHASMRDLAVASDDGLFDDATALSKAEGHIGQELAPDPERLVNGNANGDEG